ncbi:tRNA (N6-isopentenyl adenosine(37)-C2)-methylthiotransferase MiaB [Aggregatilineales bacterium SYSU G02658]
MKYHIWTMGCQMNAADSQRLASELERLGHHATDDPDAADIMVVNTCVVRQQAEDKAYGRLGQMAKLKEKDPHRIIGVMGCLVGVKDPLHLRKRLPYVDVFMAPSEPQPMVDFLLSREEELAYVAADRQQRERRDALQDGEILLPLHEQGRLVSAHVPVVYGCSHACTFCIIPFRRGVERSRSVGEIVAHVRSLAQQGVKEVTLLGQIVDRYGKDIPDGPDLADLLRIVHDVAEEHGVQRVRFLTSHPNWMSERILRTVAELPRLMPQIEVPIQAGDDEVLARMKRGYTVDEYRRLIDRIRQIIPDVAIHTDVIVGFCGETEAQFMGTYRILEELKLDKVHLAKYSPRPNTVSERRMADDVPQEEKERRHAMIEALQEQVSLKINERWLGTTVEVLVEEQNRGKWAGRTPQNKLVFFEAEGDLRGQLVPVEIVATTAWSMRGRLPQTQPADEFPVPVMPA